MALNTISINDRLGDGGLESVAVFSHDSTGNVTGLVGPDGVTIPLPASQSLLSVTTIRLTAVSAALNTGTTIPFDGVIRDDLGLTGAGLSASLIRIPNNCSQFRFSFSVGVTKNILTGTYRKILPVIVSGGVSLVNLNALGLKPVVKSIWSDTTQDFDLHFSSQLLDTSLFSTPLDTTVGNENTNYIGLQLQHDAGAGLVTLTAGSSLTIECYTPAP